MEDRKVHLSYNPGQSFLIRDYSWVCKVKEEISMGSSAGPAAAKIKFVRP